VGTFDDTSDWDQVVVRGLVQNRTNR
jgi:hypothetical protein